MFSPGRLGHFVYILAVTEAFHEFKLFPNPLLSEIQIDGPLQCIVSDMTAFYVKGAYYELTLHMDLWNNEIISQFSFVQTWGQNDILMRLARLG